MATKAKKTNKKSISRHKPMSKHAAVLQGFSQQGFKLYKQVFIERAKHWWGDRELTALEIAKDAKSVKHLVWATIVSGADSRKEFLHFIKIHLKRLSSADLEKLQTYAKLRRVWDGPDEEDFRYYDEEGEADEDEVEWFLKDPDE